MRAGLLSEPHVVALLCSLFVPVHISALNTPASMHDPRDVELLRRYVGPATDDFDGGEREAFVLPDGTMQTVFLSLHGYDLGEYQGRCEQKTTAGRRDARATATFRHHGAIALRAAHGELPEAWRSIWADDAAAAAIMAEAARWPEPPPGTAGFRVFVRNSYRMYDDLHGCQLALLDAHTTRAWGRQLDRLGAQAALPREAFVELANAAVPRGHVDTSLDAASIEGELVLTVDAIDGSTCTGSVAGSFRLAPRSKREAGKRDSAACLFASRGRFTGRFTWDRAAHTLRSLRAVAVDVELAWKPDYPGRDDDFAPVHRIGIEWVASRPSSVPRGR